MSNHFLLAESPLIGSNENSASASPRIRHNVLPRHGRRQQQHSGSTVQSGGQDIHPRRRLPWRNHDLEQEEHWQGKQPQRILTISRYYTDIYDQEIHNNYLLYYSPETSERGQLEPAGRDCDVQHEEALPQEAPIQATSSTTSSSQPSSPPESGFFQRRSSLSNQVSVSVAIPVLPV